MYINRSDILQHRRFRGCCKSSDVAAKCRARACHACFVQTLLASVLFQESHTDCLLLRNACWKYTTPGCRRRKRSSMPATTRQSSCGLVLLQRRVHGTTDPAAGGVEIAHGVESPSSSSSSSSPRAFSHQGFTRREPPGFYLRWRDKLKQREGANIDRTRN